jgi:hypothetical protein
MLSLASQSDLDTFECNNNWGILEPPVDSIKNRTEGFHPSLHPFIHPMAHNSIHSSC